MKFQKIYNLLLILILAPSLHAAEGMWVPLNIQQNIKQMQKAGLKLSAEDIYSINKACLKDAVVGLTNTDQDFDSFCSASFISDNGLVITNYHPVIRFLEMFSSKENDFLKYGYWATKNQEESNCFGLQVSQLVQMVDVTDELLAHTDSLDGQKKTNVINERGKRITTKYTKGTNLKAQIVSFMGGNQYIMSIYKVYKDVRMVAAPPMTLGKFGGDEENWKWPRETADFSLLRVYVDKNNEPAAYSKENVPLKGNAFLPISLSGVKENDFVMTMGFPAHTKLYIPSFAVDYMEKIELPAKIKIRGDKLNVIKQALEANSDIKFRYTARINSIANNYLRWQGELAGLKKMNLTQQKIQEEKELTQWINGDSKRKEKYGDIVEKQRAIYDKLVPYKVADIYFNEAGINGAEIVPFTGKFEKLIQMFNRKKVNSKAVEGEAQRLLPLADQFFKNWDFEVDREIYRDMFYLYFKNVDPKFVSASMRDALAAYNGDVDLYSKAAFENSIFTHKERVEKFLQNVDSTSVKSLLNDPVYKLSLNYYKVYTEKVANQMRMLQKDQADLYQLYMEAIAENKKGQLLPPDANQTQRLTYGQVVGATPLNGVKYEYKTTIDGLFEKNIIHSDNQDYYVPKKLRELYDKKDFGKYGTKQTLQTCFLTDCHTSSANSGSPVLNANGQLVGLNFDRIVEGVASDYKYLPELSRNIVVDVRYVLFLLDKYSPSKYVLNEVKIDK